MSTAGCPRTLYKYFSPDRVSTLENAMLRYTPLGGFNDPFEGRPEITGITNAPEQSFKRLSEIMPDEIKNAYEKLPEASKNNIDYETYNKRASEFIESVKSEYLQGYKNLTPIAISRLHQDFDKNIGALCLSEAPDSILMWSHYASSHTGFAIEFNARHPCFHAKRSENDELRHLRRVLYRDTRASALLSEMDFSEFFLIKSNHWSYEREWRIMQSLAEADLTIPEEPFPIHLFKFPKNAVTGIVLGARSTEQTEKSIRDIVRSIEGYESVTLKRATPSESHFALQIRKIAQ